MANINSTNLYELLGNDHDEDSDKEPEPPPKVVDKPVARTSKRNAPDTTPSESRGGHSGHEEAGYVNNRSKPADDGVRQGRGGRGGRGRGGRGDRHNRGLPNDHVKQADQSWGAPTGESEWNDEQAGEAIAKADEAAEPAGWNTTESTTGGGAGWDNTGATAKEATGATGAGGSEWDNAGATGWDSTEAAGGAGEWDSSANAVPDSESKPEGEYTGTDAAAGQPAAEPEPEDNSKSYADYLAEQAEKKLRLNDNVREARKPNEGSKQDKKWAQAKAFTKDEEDDEYMAGKSGKEKRERQRKEKTRLEVDLRYVEPSGGRGGGERGRGGRGRGGERGRGRGRGDAYRGRGDGEYRGGGYRGNRGDRDVSSVNVSDESAFPSLGGS